MKRSKNLILPIADPDNLRLAFWKAGKGKRNAPNVRVYQRMLEENLYKLRQEILSGEVQVGRYKTFVIYEPKERKICASAFREQVLHHAIMNVCHNYFESKHIYDSYASRKGKGSHSAIDRARMFTRKYSFYLKLDVKKFFASVHHDVIRDQLARMFKDYRLLEIFHQIIDSYEDSLKRGVPIGNLTSQYLANHYLVGLDHFIKEKLRVKAYVRYMDDMVLWADEKKKLREALQVIERYVQEELLCELKPIQLNKTIQGLPFLGFRIYPYHMRLTQQSKQRFIRKFCKLNSKYHSGEWDEATCQSRILPLIAFIDQGDSRGFKQALLQKV
ncbi:MAG: reverse transcriptase domain-containing protein [Bacteroidota bacterium]